MAVADSFEQPFAAGYMLTADQGVADFGSAVKAAGISTGGAFTLIESHTTGGAPLHVHSREDEYFYVIAGTIRVTCDAQVFVAEPRAFVALPRGIPHAWDVEGDGPATLLMMTVPAALEAFLHEYHAAPAAMRGQIAATYGITFLPDTKVE